MNARALMTATAAAVLAVLATASPAAATGGKGKPSKHVETTVTEVNYQELSNKVTTTQKNDVDCKQKDEGDVVINIGGDYNRFIDEQTQKCSASNSSRVDAENDADLYEDD